MITESASSGNVHSSDARDRGAPDRVFRDRPARSRGGCHRAAGAGTAPSRRCGRAALRLRCGRRLRDRSASRRDPASSVSSLRASSLDRRCARGVAGGRVRDGRAREDEHGQPRQQPTQRDSAHFCHGGHDLLDVKTARTGRDIPGRARFAAELRYNCAMRGAFFIAALLAAPRRHAGSVRCDDQSNAELVGRRHAR